MPGVKTNERPGTRAVLRHYRMSATKARQVLDLVRGHDVDRAHEILRATPREGARVVAKVLESAVANARNNDGLDPDELYVSACYADEGTTIKRWRPRARGRATRIRKRTCHITVVVSRLPEDRLTRRRARQAASTGALRSRRVAASRRRAAPELEETAMAEEAVDFGEDLDLEPEDVDEDLDTEDLDTEDLDDQLDTEDLDTEDVDDEAVTAEADVEPAAEADTEAAAEADTEAQDMAAAEEDSPAPRGRRGRATKAAEAEEGAPLLRPKGLRRSRRAKTEDEAAEDGEAAAEADEAGDGEESDE